MTATDVGVGRLVRDVDWSTTALGPRADWPACLDAAFSTMLSSDAAMLLLVGPDHTAIWNPAWEGLGHCDPGRVRLRDLAQLQGLLPLVKAVQSDRGPQAVRGLSLGGPPQDVMALPLFGADDRLAGILVTLAPAPDAEQLDSGPFAAIVASADDAILSVDRHLRILSWNGGARRLYGYDADEAMGQPVWMLSRRPDEDRAALDLVLRGQRHPPRNAVRWRKDGSVVHVSLAVSPVLDPQGQIIGAAHIARDGTASHDIERLHRLLVGEMKHRVKNILSTVQAIARQTLGSERTAAYEAFEKRILALGRAQDLITRDAREGVDLKAVIAAVLSPFPQGQISQDGPSLRFSSRAAVALTLGLHELATNALKYGALSQTTGKVRVTWDVTASPNETFSLHWRETGGPAVVPTQHRGFGSVLILDVLAAELQGQVDLRLLPDGAECDVLAPMASVQEQAL